MEENNYYIPKKEELHIGFECEVYGIEIVEDEKVETYFPFIIGKSERFNTIPLDMIYRVKYLDKEDIESLGWIDGETRGMTPYLITNLENDDFQMYLHDNLDKGYWYIEIYDWDAQYVFRGNIKNRSELKKLMQQLQINDNNN